MILVGIPSLGWMVTEVAKNWRKVRVSEQLAALKQTMIDRGMTADEIERVLKAGVPKREQQKEQLAKTT
jgi:hypothetical protein